jgi:hypothetical protein
MMTVPLGILGAGIFAVLPMVPVNTRLRIMAFGTVGLWLLSMARGGLGGFEVEKAADLQELGL